MKLLGRALAAAVALFSTSAAGQPAGQQHAPQRCAAPGLRVNCAGPPGGKAGCLARGCCYDDTEPGHSDWCSHFNRTKPPPSPSPPPTPPPPPSPLVWQAGRNTASGGERVLVHANGAITLELGAAGQWLGQSAPSACIGGASSKAAVTVGAGVATDGSDPRLGPFLAYTFPIAAPAPLRGGFLSAKFFPGVPGGAAFEFGVLLAAAVRPGSGHGACLGQPIISFPFGGRVLQNSSWLTWRGEMVRHAYGSSVQTDTGVGTAPLVLAGAAGATVVVAPADEFLTTQVALSDGSLTVGPLLTLSSGLPAGYSYTVSATLSSSAGVTQTMMDWGRTLQRKYPNTPLLSNPLNEQLSYTTALGEYYDYLAWQGEGPPAGGPTPQDALLNVSQHFRANELPIKLIMLDIWWVPNDYRGQPWRHCMYDWQPHGGYFPKGLNWLADATGAGMMPYANYLCGNSTYSKSGEYHTMNGSNHGNVLPADSARFWSDRFADAKENFSMTSFWNDHMAENMDQYAETRTAPGAMRLWMKGQADAALATQTPVMWCMERGSEMVQAVEFAAVTTARASGDYHPPSSNWFLGPESLLLAAIGKVASKDGINTGAGPNHEGKTEANPLLHTLTAVLTRGPVSVGDAVGMTNWAVLKPCCSSSGDILAPSAALRPIDATYQPGSVANGLVASPKGFGAGQVVWTAHSRVGSSAAAWTVLAVALPEQYSLKPDELWPPPNSTGASLHAFTWGNAGCAADKPASGCLHAVAEDQPLLLDTPKKEQGKLPLQHSVVVPELADGWVVLGEMAKYVTLSPARFTGITVAAAQLTMEVRGAVGEVVTVLLRKPAAAALCEVTLRIGPAGTATATVRR
jgi:hypothetical protein